MYGFSKPGLLRVVEFKTLRVCRSCRTRGVRFPAVPVIRRVSVHAEIVLESNRCKGLVLVLTLRFLGLNGPEASVRTSAVPESARKSIDD